MFTVSGPTTQAAKARAEQVGWAPVPAPVSCPSKVSKRRRAAFTGLWAPEATHVRLHQGQLWSPGRCPSLSLLSG